MKFLSYIKWQAKLVKSTKQDDIVCCPECDGEGEISYVCDHCDSEVEKSCPTCDSSGSVEFGGLSEFDKKKCFKRFEYNESLMEDLKRVISWCGGTIGDYGFTSEKKESLDKTYIYKDGRFVGTCKDL